MQFTDHTVVQQDAAHADNAVASDATAMEDCTVPYCRAGTDVCLREAPVSWAMAPS